MPTGYTAGVQDGSINTFEQFAMQCARAFGATILMRDDPLDKPIPEEFEPSDYYEKALAQAQADLDSTLAMSASECEAAARQEHRETCERYAEYRENERVERERYVAMLAKVEAWTPPTSEHEGMKKFMREQLNESIKFDCGNYYANDPPMKSGSEWRTERIASLGRSVSRYVEEQAKEIERTNNRSDWVKQLRESLKGE